MVGSIMQPILAHTGAATRISAASRCCAWNRACQITARPASKIVWITGSTAPGWSSRVPCAAACSAGYTCNGILASSANGAWSNGIIVASTARAMLALTGADALAVPESTRVVDTQYRHAVPTRDSVTGRLAPRRSYRSSRGWVSAPRHCSTRPAPGLSRSCPSPAQSWLSPSPLPRPSPNCCHPNCCHPAHGPC